MIRSSIVFVCCLIALPFLTTSTLAQDQKPYKSKTEDDVPAQKYLEPPFRKKRTIESWSNQSMDYPSSSTHSARPPSPKYPGRQIQPGATNSGLSTPAVRSNPNAAPVRSLSPSAPRISYENGIRTIKVKDGQRMIMIVEHPHRGITVEITRSYDPSKHGDLKRKIPELAEYVEMFPNEMDSHRIELSVKVVSTYKGETPEAIQDQNVGAYNIYRRYVKAADEQEGKSRAQTNNGSGKRIIHAIE